MNPLLHLVSASIAVLLLLCCSLRTGGAQTSGARCNDIACELEQHAASRIEKEPAALEESISLLAHAIFHNPSLRLDRILRQNLELFRVPVHTFNKATAAAVDGDGRWLAIGGADGTIALYDGTTWIFVKSWRPTSEAIVALAFSPGGKYLASGSGHVVSIIDIDRLKVIGTVQHNSVIRALAFTADGTRIASLSDDPVIRIADLADSTREVDLFRTGSIRKIYFSLEGTRLLAVGWSGNLQIFDSRQGGKPTSTISLGSYFRCADVSPDRTWVATCGDKHSVRLTRIPRDLNPIDFVDDSSVSAVVFDRNSEWLATGTDAGTVHIYHLDTRLGKETELVHSKGAGAVTALAFSDDTRWLAVGKSDNTVRLLDVSTGTEMGRIKQSSEVRSLWFTPRSNLLVSMSRGGEVLISRVTSSSERYWTHGKTTMTASLSHDRRLAIATPADGVILFDLNRATSYKLSDNRLITYMVFSEGSDFLMTGDEKSQIQLFDISPSSSGLPRPINVARAVITAPQGDKSINTALFNPKGDLLLIGDMTGVVQSIRPRFPDSDALPIIRSSTVRSLTMSANGELLVVGGSDGKAHVYESQLIQQLRMWVERSTSPLSCTGSILSLLFVSNAKHLLLGCSDGHLRLYNINNGEILKDISYPGAIVSLESDARDTLFIATSEGSIHIVNIETGEETGEIASHDMQIELLVFDPNTKSLWCLAKSYSEDLTSWFLSVHQFPTDSEGLIQQACALTSGYISEEIPVLISVEPPHDICRTHSN